MARFTKPHKYDHPSASVLVAYLADPARFRPTRYHQLVELEESAVAVLMGGRCSPSRSQRRCGRRLFGLVKGLRSYTDRFEDSTECGHQTAEDCEA